MDIGQIFGDVVAGILGHPAVQMGLRLTAAYLVILWLAVAFWTFRDARQRTRDPITPYLAAGGVLVLTPLLFPLALLAYRVVRPPETLTERATRDLESYVLEASVPRTSCPACRRRVADEWVRCPACGSDLAGSCRSCGARIEFDWSVCAWCAHDLEPLMSPEPAAVTPAIDVPAATAMLGGVSGDAERGVAAPDVDSRPVRRDAIPGWDPTAVISRVVRGHRAGSSARGRDPVPGWDPGPEREAPRATSPDDAATRVDVPDFRPAEVASDTKADSSAMSMPRPAPTEDSLTEEPRAARRHVQTSRPDLVTSPPDRRTDRG